MTEWRIDEHQLHRLNTRLTRSDQVLLWNCTSRTAQESALFPMMPYLMSTFIDSYYRYPDLLRKATEQISPEVCGRRAREVSCKLSKLTSWAALNYYLNGRALLVNFGVLRPEDNLEDLYFMIDWHERFALSYHRQAGHLYTLDSGDLGPELPERTVQVLEADSYQLAGHPKLATALRRCIAMLTQYSFLAHAESRTGLNNSGPYRVDDDHVLLTRDFFNLTECDMPWMDEVADLVEHGSLTFAIVVRDVDAEITDWGSLYTIPEQLDNNVVSVGLYTSDWLSDRYQPVGMDSREELTRTLEDIAESIERAIAVQYQVFGDMSWLEMVHAGMVTYFQSPSDVAHMAGTYRQSDWDFIDDRTERFLALMNEEYARDAYMDKFVNMSSRHSASSNYFIHPVSKSQGRGTFLVPEGVLVDHDYPRRVNTNGLADCKGSSSLPPKTGKYATSVGRLSESAANEAARAFNSPLVESPFAHFDDNWVKYHSEDPAVQDMYRYTQDRSRLLRGRGSTLTHEELLTIRAEAGEAAW